MEHNDVGPFHDEHAAHPDRIMDEEIVYGRLADEVLAVAAEMRAWMNDHRWLQVIDDWATRLENAP